VKTTKFSIGGYNFDDWSLVKELYVPTDVSSSVDRSLHVRGREDYPGSPSNSNPALRHHLQHYVIPYGKVFIAFALTNVEITTTSGIGLFGTGKAYGRYPESHQQPGDANPGAPYAWAVDHTPDYYACATWGTLVVNRDMVVYECIQTHAPSLAREPGYGADWAAYWHTHDETWAEDWADGKWYYFNELAMVTVEGIEGAYMCMVDHTSSLDNKPCSGKDWDYGDGGIWNPGDEFQADLTSQFGFSEQVLHVSKGTDKPFSGDIIAVFERNVENRLRRIDAMTTGGTMKAGATLYGIEVNA